MSRTGPEATKRFAKDIQRFNKKRTGETTPPDKVAVADVVAEAHKCSNNKCTITKGRYQQALKGVLVVVKELQKELTTAPVTWHLCGKKYRGYPAMLCSMCMGTEGDFDPRDKMVEIEAANADLKAELTAANERVAELEHVSPELTWFMLEMQATIDRNNHKSGWEDMTLDEICYRLKQEVAELQSSCTEGIIGEACDVGVFAMFAARNRYVAISALSPKQEGGG